MCRPFGVLGQRLLARAVLNVGVMSLANVCMRTAGKHMSPADIDYYGNEDHKTAGGNIENIFPEIGKTRQWNSDEEQTENKINLIAGHGDFINLV
jgi:hypothetical protein